MGPSIPVELTMNGANQNKASYTRMNLFSGSDYGLTMF
jgi:hypothetical protein